MDRRPRRGRRATDRNRNADAGTALMPTPEPVPAGLFETPTRSFLDAWQPEDLVYFVLNVGDGDTQLLLLPARDGEKRRCLVVDVASTAKLAALVRALVEAERLELHPELFSIVVA